MKTVFVFLGLLAMAILLLSFVTEIAIPAFFFTLKFWVVLLLLILIVVWVRNWYERRRYDE